ncbi:ROK family protein [Paenibacillus sp. GCM10027627]|uniref:ROK family protein n=1 Tax=unclassified Paenibacillus TaxID=185978 RepID=UPI0036334C3E
MTTIFGAIEGGVLSPEMIMFGGGVDEREHLFPPVREEVRKLQNGYVQHDALTDGIEHYIVKPALSEFAGLKGALALAARASRSAPSK